MDENYIAYKKKRKLLNIMAEVTAIIGGILVFRTPNTTIMTTIGIMIVLISLFFNIKVLKLVKIANSAGSEIYDKETQFIKKIIEQQGIGIVLIAACLGLGLAITGIILFFSVSHSWIRALLCWLAFGLVMDLRDYFNIAPEK